MNSPDDWIAHSPMSNPGRYSGMAADLPADVSRLNEIIQGVLVHSSWLRDYGLDEARPDATARTTLPIAERLEDIFLRDPQSLQEPRPAERRSIGTCRDFALMLTSFLRCKGIAARMRCGFASYFSTEWEDHWVCEYWDTEIGTSRLSDAQIDQMLKRRNHIEFDASDMPRKVFMSAGDAWLKCRRGEADPHLFGHGSVTGMWFLKVNVLRDHYVLNGRETSDWDRWREAAQANRFVQDHELEMLDDLAASPEQTLISILPDWLEC